MALVLMSSMLSAWWIVGFGLLVLPFVFAPQPMRPIDRRIPAALVAVVLAVGLEVFTKICDWCPYCIECWFL